MVLLRRLKTARALSLLVMMVPFVLASPLVSSPFPESEISTSLREGSAGNNSINDTMAAPQKQSFFILPGSNTGILFYKKRFHWISQKVLVNFFEAAAADAMGHVLSRTLSEDGWDPYIFQGHDTYNHLKYEIGSNRGREQEFTWAHAVDVARTLMQLSYDGVLIDPSKAIQVVDVRGEYSGSIGWSIIDHDRPRSGSNSTTEINLADASNGDDGDFEITQSQAAALTTTAMMIPATMASSLESVTGAKETFACAIKSPPHKCLVTRP